MLPLVLLLIAAPPAPADPLAALGITVAKPLAPAEAARVRAEVDRELARTGAAAEFDNVSDAYAGRVRHRRSGLTCALGTPGAVVSAQADGSARCAGKGAAGPFETTIAPAPAGATLDQVAAAVLERARREPGFRPYSGINVVAQPKPGTDGVEHRTLRFHARQGFGSVFVTERVGLFGPWLLIERSVGAPPKPGEPDMKDLMGEIMFGAALKPAAGPPTAR